MVRDPSLDTARDPKRQAPILHDCRHGSMYPATQPKGLPHRGAGPPHSLAAAASQQRILRASQQHQRSYYGALPRKCRRRHFRHARGTTVNKSGKSITSPLYAFLRYDQAGTRRFSVHLLRKRTDCKRSGEGALSIPERKNGDTAMQGYPAVCCWDPSINTSWDPKSNAIITQAECSVNSFSCDYEDRRTPSLGGEPRHMVAENTDARTEVWVTSLRL